MNKISHSLKIFVGKFYMRGVFDHYSDLFIYLTIFWRLSSPDNAQMIFFKSFVLFWKA